jgi:GT2 family glycosyltransferase
MKLGVVVLNWNGKDVTPRCLESIARSACPPDQIVVVDNASADGSADLVRAAFPQVTLVVNDSNLGFAEGNNVGIRLLLERACDLVLLLNNDAVLDAQALCELKRAAEARPAAAYGAAIYELAAPGALWYGGGTISRLTLDARHETAAECARGAPRPTDFVTGCCLMFRADALRRIGLLDKEFFAYYEDLDWSLRAREAGERLLFVPGAIVHHEVSHTFRRASAGDAAVARHVWAQGRPLVLYLAYRNRLLLARKHAANTLHLAFLVVRRLARAATHAAMLVLSGRSAQAHAVVQGTKDGLQRPLRRPRIEDYARASPAAPD